MHGELSTASVAGPGVGWFDQLKTGLMLSGPTQQTGGGRRNASRSKVAKEIVASQQRRLGLVREQCYSPSRAVAAG
jgi:hypothetical protein